MKSFLIGSSLPSILVTMSYLGYYFRMKGRPSDIPYEMFPIFIPLFFGIFAYIEENIIKSPPLTGALLGLSLSLIGRFGLNLPQRMFGFNKSNEYQVHIIAMILYAMIFTYIVKPLIRVP